MKKILIIEDERDIAELEKDYLEMDDFEVTIQMDGEYGLEDAISNDYDMVLLDLMLPGMDGFEICKEIRKEKNVPILMISARKDDIDKTNDIHLCKRKNHLDHSSSPQMELGEIWVYLFYQILQFLSLIVVLFLKSFSFVSHYLVN